LVFALICSISLRAAQLPSSPGIHKGSEVSVDGHTRTFDYYIPAARPPGVVPLVFVMHGYGGEADQVTGEGGYTAPHKIWRHIADSVGFLCVYPEGSFSDVDTNKRGWNDCRETAESNPFLDDVRFVTSLLDTISSAFPIDTSAVFATGTSNGGFMALRLAVEAPDRFCAVAAIAASMPMTSECRTPTAPVSVLFMNGTEDPVLPFHGGSVGDTTGVRGDALSSYAAVDVWLEVNNIATTPMIDSIHDTNPFDASRVTRHRWGPGPYDKTVVLYEVAGGGHTEPSQAEKYSEAFQDDFVGEQNHDIEMAEEVWAFFADASRIATVPPQPIRHSDAHTILREAGGAAYDLLGRRMHPTSRRPAPHQRPARVQGQSCPRP